MRMRFVPHRAKRCAQSLAAAGTMLAALSSWAGGNPAVDDLAARTDWTRPIAAAEAPALDARTLARLRLNAITRAGERLIAVGEDGSVLVSDDRGAHWSPGANAFDAMLTAVDFTSADTGYAVGHDALILISRDRGRHWFSLQTDLQDPSPLLQLRMHDAKLGLAVGAYGRVLRTEDGQTWTRIAHGDDDRHVYGIAWVDARRVVVVGERGLILASDDAGLHWRAVASPYDGSLFGVLALPDGALIAYGMRGRLLRSTDAGAHWQMLDTPTPTFLFGADRAPDGRIWIAGGNGSLLESHDGGAHFSLVETGRKDDFAGVLALDARTLVLVGDHGPFVLHPGAAREGH